MKSIRIGNDINIEWSIFREGQPYNLEGLRLSLYLKNIFGRDWLDDYTISGNTISWTFFGKDQEYIGKYTLELVINEDRTGMATTDYVDFVYLTPKTSCCQGEDEENITTETIELSSTMEFAPTVIQGGGGSIDPELLEGFMPLSRDFSDDFNNDFAR